MNNFLVDLATKVMLFTVLLVVILGVLFLVGFFDSVVDKMER